MKSESGDGKHRPDMRANDSAFQKPRTEHSNTPTEKRADRCGDEEKDEKLKNVHGKCAFANT
jgi:hypothetical protein